MARRNTAIPEVIGEDGTPLAVYPDPATGRLVAVQPQNSIPPGERDPEGEDDDMPPGEEFADDSPESQLARAIGEIESTSGGGLVEVYRKRRNDQGTTVRAWCTAYPLAEFSIATVARDFGGGDYLVLVKDAKRRIRKRAEITIEPNAKPFTANAPAQSQSAPHSDIAALANVMTAGFARLGELVAQAVQVNKPQSRTEWLNEMMMYKQLFAASTADPISLLKSVLELQKELSFTSGEADPSPTALLMRAAEHLLPAIVEASKQNAAPQMPTLTPMQPGVPIMPQPGAPLTPLNPAMPPVRAPNPVPTPAPVQVAQQPEGELVNVQEMKLRAGVAFLAQQAQANADPHLYAELVLDQVGDDDYVYQFLNRPDWLDTLARYHPSVKATSAWWQSLREAMLAMLTEGGDEGISPSEENPAGINGTSPGDTGVAA